MAHQPVHTLALDPRLLDRLTECRITTAAQLLSAGVLEISDLLDVAPGTANEILAAVSAAAMQNNVTTVWQLHCSTRSTPRHLPTLMPELDAALRGGVACGRITELVGPAGVGKTQFCLQLALSAALSAATASSTGAQHPPAVTRRKVLYIDTEGKFNSSRLYQMATVRFPDLAALDSHLSHVSIFRVHNSQELLNVVQEVEGHLSSGTVSLLLLDSIAAAVRPEFGVGQTLQRQQLLGQLASILKQYAEQYRLPVVITNQITTVVGGPAEQQHMPGEQDSFPNHQQPPASKIVASLGAVWAHAVTVRVVLEYAEGSRALKIVKSPDCPAALLYYTVTPQGVNIVEAPPGADSEGQHVFGSVLGLAIANTGYNMPAS